MKAIKSKGIDMTARDWLVQNDVPDDVLRVHDELLEALKEIVLHAKRPSATLAIAVTEIAKKAIARAEGRV